MVQHGSTRADEVADVTVDALHQDFTPYILDETPPVLSVGVRCMEQGYSFVWPADSRPYFIRPDHKVIELKIDGWVPVIDPSCKVISGKQFKRDCKLAQLFAMASRSADPEEPEGVDSRVLLLMRNPNTFGRERRQTWKRKQSLLTTSFATTRRTLSAKCARKLA